MEAKTNRGRQKTEMKTIEKEDDRLVVFSKRRSGIYKKATELGALCGAQVGILVFSPMGKPHSFGNPSIDYVLNRFLHNQQEPILEAYRQEKILQTIENYNELVEHLDVVKECRKALRQLEEQRGSGEQKVWWQAPIKDLDLQGLKQMHDSFKRVADHVSSNLRLTQGSRFDNGTASTSAAAVSNPNPNPNQSH
ncbi:agamous-like MADS-box protein AGL61 [Pyrus x bretschneideri]|uniref:agamous-like MADS-box protein AGL61 n=1 Tax=Pyrus x bretschneideri TaxID=225117 RepID=UPI00202F9B94|nr:agamous-like MADS-box protein AGL61 [Pyrus x bretschneideri]